MSGTSKIYGWRNSTGNYSYWYQHNCARAVNNKLIEVVSYCNVTENETKNSKPTCNTIFQIASTFVFKIIAY
jgi:hypothetical protein